MARYVAQQLNVHPQAPVCIVACGLREDDSARLAKMQHALIAAGIPVRLLSEEARLLDGAVYLSALETVKGFEFSLVVITGCSSEFMPDDTLPEEEAWRDARRLYVAMTRARDEVLFTFSGTASPFLSGMADTVAWTTVEAQGLVV